MGEIHIDSITNRGTVVRCTFKRGTVAEWLDRSSLVLKVPGSQHSPCTGFFKNSLQFTRQLNKYLTLFRAGKVKGGEEEEWRPTSVTPLPVIR